MRVVLALVLSVCPAVSCAEDGKREAALRSLDLHTALTVFSVKWICGGASEGDVPVIKGTLERMVDRGAVDQRAAKVFERTLLMVQARSKIGDLTLEEFLLLPEGSMLRTADRVEICDAALRVPNLHTGAGRANEPKSGGVEDWDAIPTVIIALQGIEPVAVEAD